MNYRTERDADRRIIRVIVSGPFGEQEEALAACEELRQHAVESGSALLYDLRALDHDPGLAEMFSFPRLLNERDVARPRKVAILCSSHMDRYAFYETTAVNAGHNLRVFDNEEDALTWAASRSFGPG